MANKELAKEFEMLINEHAFLLNKICRVYTRVLQDRQDLFQEIVIQLWKSYPNFKGDAKVSTWMYKVAIYTAITGLRKKKNFIHSTEPENLPQVGSELQYDNAKDKQLENLYNAIAQLNQIEKALIMLYLEDKNYGEMEEIMGINQGNLRVKMNRIKDKLKQIIKS